MKSIKGFNHSSLQRKDKEYLTEFVNVVTFYFCYRKKISSNFALGIQSLSYKMFTQIWNLCCEVYLLLASCHCHFLDFLFVVSLFC